MIDRREVMLKAWADYRSICANYTPEQIAARGGHSFADSLRYAWKIVKQAAANIARELKEAMHPNAPAIRAIKAAIADMQYKGFKHNIAAERQRLEARLSALSI